MTSLSVPYNFFSSFKSKLEVVIGFVLISGVLCGIFFSAILPLPIWMYPVVWFPVSFALLYYVLLSSERYEVTQENTVEKKSTLERFFQSSVSDVAHKRSRYLLFWMSLIPHSYFKRQAFYGAVFLRDDKVLRKVFPHVLSRPAQGDEDPFLAVCRSENAKWFEDALPLYLEKNGPACALDAIAASLDLPSFDFHELFFLEQEGVVFFLKKFSASLGIIAELSPPEILAKKEELQKIYRCFFTGIELSPKMSKDLVDEKDKLGLRLTECFLDKNISPSFILETINNCLAQIVNQPIVAQRSAHWRLPFLTLHLNTLKALINKNSLNSAISIPLQKKEHNKPTKKRKL